MFSTVVLQSAYYQIPIAANERHYTAFEACVNFYQFLRDPFGVTNEVSSFQRSIDTIIRNEKLHGSFAYMDDTTICGKDAIEQEENLWQCMEAVKKYHLVINVNKPKFLQTSIMLVGYAIKNGTIRPNPDRL